MHVSRSVLAAISVLAAVSVAHAQQRAPEPGQAAQPRLFVNKYDCTDLGKVDPVCIVNKLNVDVVGVDCKGPDGLIWGGSKTAVKLPNNRIEAHSITVLNMPVCPANSTLIFTMKGGLSRVMLLKQSTKEMSALEVPTTDKD